MSALRTTVKLEAQGHSVTVSEDGKFASLDLDGFNLLISSDKDAPSLCKAIGEKIAYALKAPERKKTRGV